jgi:hypothetical protein
MTFTNPRAATTVNLYADEYGTQLRVNLPTPMIDVLTEDLASSTARTLVYSNPVDEAVNIPAVGFNLGATMTRPKSTAARLPAVILVGGAAAPDRDSVIAGVAVVGQLADLLAGLDIGALQHLARGGAPDAENVGQADLDLLLPRDVHTGDSCHPRSYPASLSLRLRDHSPRGEAPSSGGPRKRAPFGGPALNYP